MTISDAELGLIHSHLLGDYESMHASSSGDNRQSDSFWPDWLTESLDDLGHKRSQAPNGPRWVAPDLILPQMGELAPNSPIRVLPERELPVIGVTGFGRHHFNPQVGSRRSYHYSRKNEMATIVSNRKNEMAAMVLSLCRVVSGQSTSRFPGRGNIEKDAPLGSGPSDYDPEKEFPVMVSGLCREASGQSTSRFPEGGIIEKDAPLGSGPSDYDLEKEFPVMVSGLCREASGQSTSRFPERGIIEKDAPLGSGPSAHRAIRSLSSTGGQNTLLEARESHVNLWIKSFTVLGFFVEIPETATVSFLKKTIMEKATAVVGGGEHVDLLVQGKKIIDEKKILSETGISHESRLDVILEPKLSQDLGRSCPPSCPLQLPCDMPPLTRYSPAVAVVHQGTYDASADPLFCDLDDEVREDHEVAEYQTNISIGKNTTSSGEVILCPAMDVEALDIGPVHQTTNLSKNVQRRKSESFSASEVETLVQVVEKLGTGRWQKIKEEAFGNARNRTRMDLKDKWRSLVKTAKRPANKRRGAVIPRGLLDRVLAVETHNSQQVMQ